MKEQITLLSPQVKLEYPLMQAIANRRTKRTFREAELSLQKISDICWVACGETKVATKRAKNRRTVASGCNAQLVTLYIMFSTGVYRYSEPTHTLHLTVEGDFCHLIGTQKMMHKAPMGLIYVAEIEKKTGVIQSNLEQKMFVAGTEAALMSQNVYLYSAATNLHTALLALVDREALHDALCLHKESAILYTQVIGEAP